MVRFIQTNNGFVAGSEITNVREIDCSISSVTTRNGEHHTVDDFAENIVRILEEKREVIPASPGYNAIRRIFSKKEDMWMYETRPIIGWMRYPLVIYDQDKTDVGYPTAMSSIPIVAGNISDKCLWDIVLPDGRVIELFKIHDSIQQWFDAHGGDGSHTKKQKNKIEPDIYDEEVLVEFFRKNDTSAKGRKRTKKQASPSE